MKNYISCISHRTSEGNLLTGSRYTALFDCGMLFCAGDTIKKIKNELGTRKLDYLFATHTHYDHIGALPALRDEWPDLKLVTCETGAEILLKNTPRRVIRELSYEAAKNYSPDNADFDYNDDVFHADITVGENDRITLGDYTVRVIETPGHTRDSLSFLIEETGLLILSETTGVLTKDGNVYPAYLTSCTGSIEAINKCAELPWRYISAPHTGVTDPETARGFFEKAAETMTGCRDFILDMKKEGLDQSKMVDEYVKKYAQPDLLDMQPMNALVINARATIACTLKEFDI